MQHQKQRLDLWLVELGFCETRNQAQGLIMTRKVRLKETILEKAGHLLTSDQAEGLEVAELLPFVSRGGLKLAKALKEFPVNVESRHCLDIGASTGGFTDCLLQNGAAHVVAVDVGYGQLDWKLRQDPRVLCLEKTNIRHLTPEVLANHQISGLSISSISLVVSDVSFISLTKVFPGIPSLMAFDDKSNSSQLLDIIALLKPQFEFKDCFPEGKFDGVVRLPEHHLAILESVLPQLANTLKQANPAWKLAGVTLSPITGPKGNREFPVWFTTNPLTPAISMQTLGTLVEQAHQKPSENTPADESSIL
jgi:23S rRNA (cytidine1920-2'-O)/16S rRNA (cytidine1409-2'-O)-methyltransferase